ncbi:MAG: hypothetical protein EPN91_08270 [Salinibacterium sp.]|nr:MAG: hypothetical protein EPN91_08270 [Salinibacterium sp.]
MLTDARRAELQKVAEGWTGLGVILSPLPFVGERLSDFCHQRAAKFYMLAHGQLSTEFIINLTTLIEGFNA